MFAQDERPSRHEEEGVSLIFGGLVRVEEWVPPCPVLTPLHQFPHTSLSSASPSLPAVIPHKDGRASSNRILTFPVGENILGAQSPWTRC